MNIAIIGAGLTGLTAGYRLSKLGHKVTIFEKEPFVGGLAHGFRPAPARNAPARNASQTVAGGSHSDAGGTRSTIEKWPATRSLGEGWDWSLEAFYHHIFSNDHAIMDLVREIGCDKELFFSRPVTATLIPNDTKLYPLDSPTGLLSFSPLSPLSRIQTGMMLAFLKANPFWQPMENLTAERFIRSVGGTVGWHTLWEPLLYGKFGPYADKVAASWFWARIKKRTPSLGYFHGGFQTVAETLAQKIKSQGGIIHTGTTIQPIQQNTHDSSFIIPALPARFAESRRAGGQNSKFDAVLLTVPSQIAMKLTHVLLNSLPAVRQVKSIPHLWAQTLILETKEPILKNVYWLNINDRSFPFLSMVAHTNFIDKKHYGGNHITYFGNYLPDGHEYLKMDKNQLLKIFIPFIQRINPSLILNHKSLINSYLFTAPNAQPVHTLHYSRQAPPLHTPIPNMYLANMDSIYPWDRGTNYAVELGEKVAIAIAKNK